MIWYDSDNDNDNDSDNDNDNDIDNDNDKYCVYIYIQCFLFLKGFSSEYSPNLYKLGFFCSIIDSLSVLWWLHVPLTL